MFTTSSHALSTVASSFSELSNSYRRFKYILVGFIALVATVQTATADIVSNWHASSDQLPNEIVPPWTPFQSFNPPPPMLSDGVLTLTTVTNNQTLGYQQIEPVLNTMNPFFIEARLRFVSGQSSVSFRAPIGIYFSPSPGVGSTLYIDHDQLFFTAGENIAGPRVNIDTTDAFHIYRIEYDGGGGVRLLYDGAEILTGSTYTSFSDFGSQPTIGWGNVTVFASGTSEWTFFRHNALSVPEPSSFVLLALAALTGHGVRRRRNDQLWQLQQFTLVRGD